MDPEVDRREARDQADALPRAAAAGGHARGARLVAPRDVDQEDVGAQLIAVPEVSTRTARRSRRRGHRVDGDGVLRIRLPFVHRVGSPAHDPLLRPGLGDTERRLDAALILTDPLLLGAGEKRSGDQRPHDNQGEDRNRERHTALVPQNPFHASLLHEFRRP